jgi:hypothetical protein
MHVASLDIEGWTYAGERIPLVTQTDCDMLDAIQAFRLYHPNADVLRMAVAFSRGVADQRKPVTLKLCVALRSENHD